METMPPIDRLNSLVRTKLPVRVFFTDTVSVTGTLWKSTDTEFGIIGTCDIIDLDEVERFSVSPFGFFAIQNIHMKHNPAYEKTEEKPLTWFQKIIKKFKN